MHRIVFGIEIIAAIHQLAWLGLNCTTQLRELAHPQVSEH